MKQPSAASSSVDSGVGVLDKAVGILDVVAAGPSTLADLVAITGISRATAYRLAVALEAHSLLVRGDDGRFRIGPHVGSLAAVIEHDPLDVAGPAVLSRLRDLTGESAQLYRRFGDVRRCIAAAEPPSGLRDTVPVGAELPMTAGSAAQVLLAWEPLPDVEKLLRRAAFGVTQLATVRRRGWAASVAERESGVASVSAPIVGADGRVVAALSVSGPIDRLTRSPGRLYAGQVIAAAEALSKAIHS